MAILEQVVDVQHSREWVIDTKGVSVRHTYRSNEPTTTSIRHLKPRPPQPITTGGGSVSWGDRGQSKPASPKRRDSKAGGGADEGPTTGGADAEGGAGDDVDDSCSILPGGVLWSDHGGNSQDLVIVTERGVDMYKVRG